MSPMRSVATGDCTAHLDDSSLVELDQHRAHRCSHPDNKLGPAVQTLFRKLSARVRAIGRAPPAGLHASEAALFIHPG